MHMQPPRLIPATEPHLIELSAWFKSESEAICWGGSTIRFPILVTQLMVDIQWDNGLSFSLMENDRLLGFAQAFERYGFYHLCRIAVHPRNRGEGFGKLLMRKLLDRVEFDQRGFSLFVYASNRSARKFYEAMGFHYDTCPDEKKPNAESLFMVRQ